MLFDYGTIAVKAAPTPLLSKAVLRTASENKPRCPASNSNNTKVVPTCFGAIAVKAAPTPLPSNTVLRTDSESKPRCPEHPEAYNFTTYNILLTDMVARCRLLAAHGARTQPLTATGAPSQTSTIPYIQDAADCALNLLMFP